MFEIAELGHEVSKAEYNLQVPELRTKLLVAQQQLKSKDFTVIIIISGVDGGGKGEVLNLLNEWMDPRYLRTIAFDKPSEEEKQRPKYWRYWLNLPEKGAIGIFVGSWYSESIASYTQKKINRDELKIELLHINQFEQELIDDGALIIKCWLHLNKKTQKKRLKDLEKNPETAWRVSARDKKNLKIYADFVQAAEQVLKATGTGQSPWLIVDGSDVRYSSLTVGEHLLKRINHHIEHRTQLHNNQYPKNTSSIIQIEQQSLLESLDLTKILEKKTYNDELAYYQGKLNKLARKAQARKISSIIVFEGWDAAGKGGSIRRLTRAMDARNYQVISVAAPSDEEAKHHYLWRFWRHIPRAGKVTIYDRSWYGRVLVERVEGFASGPEWMRAYSEIVNFEEALSHHGILIVKFWLHIDRDEQLKRFKEREKISYKQHKITEEDYRNREQWENYIIAVNDMVTRTSIRSAPWVLVESSDKRYARIKVLKTYCDMLESRLD